MEHRLGFIQDKLDLKILILFILRRLPAPVDDNTLAELTLIDDAIVFFDYAECLAELQSTGHIQKTEAGWEITDKGNRNGETTEGSLPYVIRVRAEKKLAPLAEKMRRNALIKTTCKPRLTGGCDLHLAMSEGDGAVLELKLLVPGEAQAKKMSENFRRNAEEIYGHLVEYLLKD